MSTISNMIEKPPVGKLIGTALKRCRDAEVIWEERLEIDLAQPNKPLHISGWGLRINSEGQAGWHWADSQTSPETLLEKALEDSRINPRPAALYSQGLPYTGKQSPPAPLNPEEDLQKLHAFVQRMQFFIPALCPDISLKIGAKLMSQRVHFTTRSGERQAVRTLYSIHVYSDKDPFLKAEYSGSFLPSSPDTLLRKLLWQAQTLTKRELRQGEYPVLFSEESCAKIIEILANHLTQPECYDKVGLENWLSPLIHLASIPQHSNGGYGPQYFDGEATPTHSQLPIIESGRLLQPLWERQTSHNFSLKPEGFGQRGWGTPPQSGYTNLKLMQGEKTLPALLASEKPQIWVDYLIPQDYEEGSLSFQAVAPIAFLMKNGKAQARLPILELTLHLEELLGAKLRALGLNLSWSNRHLTPALACNQILTKPFEGSEISIHPPSELGLW